MDERVNEFLRILYPECDIYNLDSNQLADKKFI